MTNILTRQAFAALMAPLGPWGARRRVAVAVSGGADSLCLAWLAAGWGAPLALIVDHGLRPDSAAEAALTASRLATFGVPARILRLDGLRPGPALAARARAARYEALTAATLEAGCLDLLVAHHRDDQAETLLIRRARGSGPAGLAGMAEVACTAALRLVRPLLAVPPSRLSDTLRAAGIDWVEDPSNRDPAAHRTRARATLADAGETLAAALAAEAAGHAEARAAADRANAEALAARAGLRPEGFAVLSGRPLAAASLSALLQAIGGTPYPPATAAVARLAHAPAPCVVAGVRLLPAGHLGDGLLLVREAASMAPDVTARPGALWDRRFRLGGQGTLPDDATLGAVGAEAARLRDHTPLPAAVLATLPALRRNGVLAAVPHIGYLADETCAGADVFFTPARPAAAAPWRGPVGGCESAKAPPC